MLLSHSVFHASKIESMVFGHTHDIHGGKDHLEMAQRLRVTRVEPESRQHQLHAGLFRSGRQAGHGFVKLGLVDETVGIADWDPERGLEIANPDHEHVDAGGVGDGFGVFYGKLL